MVDLVPSRPPQSVAEDLGTGHIPGKISTILAGRFRTIFEDGSALPSDKRSGRGIHSFLAQLAWRVDHVPGLERLILVGVDPNIMVHLLHSLLSVPVDLYSTILRLFACWGELSAKGLPPVVDIPHESFAAWLSICAVPQVDYITHLLGISLTNWHTMPCKRMGKTDEAEYLDLACRGLTFVPLDCTYWLLEMEEDGHLNVHTELRGLFPMLTGQ